MSSSQTSTLCVTWTNLNDPIIMGHQSSTLESKNIFKFNPEHVEVFEKFMASQAWNSGIRGKLDGKKLTPKIINDFPLNNLFEELGFVGLEEVRSKKAKKEVMDLIRPKVIRKLIALYNTNIGRQAAGNAGLAGSLSPERSVSRSPPSLSPRGPSRILRSAPRGPPSPSPPAPSRASRSKSQGPPHPLPQIPSSNDLLSQSLANILSSRDEDTLMGGGDEDALIGEEGEVDEELERLLAHEGYLRAKVNKLAQAAEKEELVRQARRDVEDRQLETKQYQLNIQQIREQARRDAQDQEDRVLALQLQQTAHEEAVRIHKEEEESLARQALKTRAVEEEALGIRQAGVVRRGNGEQEARLREINQELSIGVGTKQRLLVSSGKGNVPSSPIRRQPQSIEADEESPKELEIHSPRQQRARPRPVHFEEDEIKEVMNIPSSRRTPRRQYSPSINCVDLEDDPIVPRRSPRNLSISRATNNDRTSPTPPLRRRRSSDIDDDNESNDEMSPLYRHLGPRPIPKSETLRVERENAAREVKRAETRLRKLAIRSGIME